MLELLDFYFHDLLEDFKKLDAKITSSAAHIFPVGPSGPSGFQRVFAVVRASAMRFFHFPQWARGLNVRRCKSARNVRTSIEGRPPQRHFSENGKKTSS